MNTKEYMYSSGYLSLADPVCIDALLYASQITVDLLKDINVT